MSMPNIRASFRRIEKRDRPLVQLRKSQTQLINTASASLIPDRPVPVDQGIEERALRGVFGRRLGRAY